jgi:hypothetical protein
MVERYGLHINSHFALMFEELNDRGSGLFNSRGFGVCRSRGGDDRSDDRLRGCKGVWADTGGQAAPRPQVLTIRGSGVSDSGGSNFFCG